MAGGGAIVRTLTARSGPCQVSGPLGSGDVVMTPGRGQDKRREAAILTAGIRGPQKGRAMEGNSEEEPDWLSGHSSRRQMDWAG